MTSIMPWSWKFSSKAAWHLGDMSQFYFLNQNFAGVPHGSLAESMQGLSVVRQQEPRWSRVGSQGFVTLIKQNLGRAGKTRQLSASGQGFALKEDGNGLQATFYPLNEASKLE